MNLTEHVEPIDGNAASRRERLRAGLREVRRILATHSNQAGYKVMAPMAGTAPKRLAELDNDSFFLDFSAGEGRAKDQAVLAKTVIGFSTSVYRVVHWVLTMLSGDTAYTVLGSLVTEPSPGIPAGVSDAEVKELVSEYWPTECFEFPSDSPVANRWIEQGLLAAAGVAARQSSLSLSVAVVDWGPFSRAEPGFVAGSETRSAARTLSREFDEKLGIIDSPLVNYAGNLLSAIDPVQFQIDADGLFDRKPFAEALSGLPKSRAGQWKVALGLYDSLFRQFEGYCFVTLPVRVPVMGLRLSQHRGESTRAVNIDFAASLSAKDLGGGVNVVHVLSHEAGHLAMGRIRASADIVPLSLPDAVPETVFASLKDAIVASGSDVLFVSDTILCHGVWSLAQTDPDCSCVELISQTHPAEFSFRNGFMVREGDAKLIEMLRWAQQEVFRSSSKTKHILEHLVTATRNWQSGIDGWSQKFFIIDQECIAELAPTRRHRQAILEYVRDSAADIIQIDCESES